MEKKKVLGIFCHPDDEILFGWPIFQSDQYEKYLLVICDDHTRRGACRKQALELVCQKENIQLLGCLSEDNNFYALPTRNASYLLSHAINNINIWIDKIISEGNFDYIFTHNPVGEYGHGSHRLLFELVSQHEKVENLLITDMCQISNHRSHIEIPSIVKSAYYNNRWMSEKLDLDFYNRCYQIYKQFDAWTWSKDPINYCSLYLLKN